ncbi:MAG TPA: hypothetical protein VIU61_24680 [Kofleriaceae bacterium]
MRELDFDDVLATARAEIDRLPADASALDLVFFAACEEVARRVVLRYQFTTGPRLLEALEFPERCPADYPQALAWKTGVATLHAIASAIAARHGDELAAEVCRDPISRIARIYRDGLTR